MKRPNSNIDSGSRSARAVFIRVAAVTVFCLIAFLTQTAAAVPLISVPDITVDEGDSIDYRTVQVPISYSGAFHLRVQIVVTLRPRGSGRPRPVNRLRGIQALSTSRTFHGTGVETILVRVRGDLNRESDEVADVKVSFINPVQGGSGGDAGVFTLRDDDHPTVTVSDSFWVEGGTEDLPDGGRHVITLSKAINQATDLRVRTINGTAIAGSDFVGVDRVITIPRGETEAEVLVRRVDDDILEFQAFDEYTVSVTAVRPGDIGVGGDPVGLGRANDDESATTQEAIFQLGSDEVPVPFLNGTVANCRSDLPVDEPFNSNVDRRFRLTFGGAVAPRFEVRIITTSPGGGGSATAGQDYDSIDRILVLQTERGPGVARPFRSAIFTVRIRDDGVTEGDERIRIEALSRIIRSDARPCGFQILLGAQSEIRINGNIL